MRLILCEPADPVAPWIQERLAARGLVAEIVTSEALCVAARWSHRLRGNGASFDILLSDGRQLRSGEIRWVLNRLVRVPDACLVAAEERDRSYAEQEWRALLCSALQSLHLGGVTVVERPDPYALSGTWRSPAEWALLAARAGLAVRRWRWYEPVPEESPPIGLVRWVLVIGESVLSDASLSADVSNASRRLAELAQMSLLEIGLTFDDNAPATFCGAQAMLDPRIGGERAIDALLTVLAE